MYEGGGHRFNPDHWLMVSRRDVIENVLGLGFVIAFLYVVVTVFDAERINALVESAGIWGPLSLILAKAATIVIAPLSGGPLYPIAGIAFGFWHGLAYIVVGDILGGAIAFWLSRRFGAPLVERFILKRNMAALQSVLSAMSTSRGFLYARICFAAMPEIVCYAAGLTKITFRRFISIHILVGVVPAAVLVASGNVLLGGNTTVSVITLALASGVALGGGILFLRYAKHVEKQNQ